MSKPVVVTNTFPTSLPVGTSADWVTRAQDPDAQTGTLTRPVQDSQGNTTVITKSVTVSDPLVYGTPTCDNPNISLVVDSNDPTIVHVSANSGA